MRTSSTNFSSLPREESACEADFGIDQGGRTILYEEDPFIRQYFAQALREGGVEPTMPAVAR